MRIGLKCIPAVGAFPARHGSTSLIVWAGLPESALMGICRKPAIGVVHLLKRRLKPLGLFACPGHLPLGKFPVQHIKPLFGSLQQLEAL